ncbi:hypothetical protein EKK58_05225 [Candidatus Dependentiae bacterium]|nr:MAG: hypothetical protein EKK58_05225 [Candidatus Dependentiae bacterium]
MAFRDLSTGILELFAEAQGYGFEAPTVDAMIIKRSVRRPEQKQEAIERQRSNATRRKAERRAELRELLGPGFRRHEYQHLPAKRQAKRKAWLNTQPTCKKCGKPILVVHKHGSLPKFCSKKCGAADRYQVEKQRLDKLKKCVDCKAVRRVKTHTRCRWCLDKKRSYYENRRRSKLNPIEGINGQAEAIDRTL